ncbi:MAG TPA: XdhC/CoxI family protein, partial [Ktedonobacterales bacterium]|nr:XdhC/CoxI family protein [Ktedonobacterales bacterium]
MFQEIAAALAQGEAIALLTVVRTHGAAPCAPGTKALLRSDGTLVGALGAASIEARACIDARRLLDESGEASVFVYHLDPDSGESVGSCGATLEVFIEPVRSEPRLLIAGSGYVAVALARLVVPLGWRVALVDDRSEFTRATRLPESVVVEVGDIASFIRAQHPNKATAVVIVTRGHRADHEALSAALATDAGYVGMIGSPSKTRAIFKALLREGVTAQTLARAHAPIGLDVHAQTPDEIALSIAAELLMWRRGGTGQPLYAITGILGNLLENTSPNADTD